MKQLIVLLLLSASAFAQAGAYPGSPVINGVGQPIANASVAISSVNPCGTSPTYANCSGQPQGIYTGSTPPPSLATLYTDITQAHTTANPLFTDPLGNWTAYATPGIYWATVYGYQIVPQVQIIVVGTGATGGGGTPGNIKAVPNCTAAGTVLNETVQESSQVVGGITQTCATIGAIGSTSVVGLCTNQGICGNTGTAFAATGNTALCIFDGQATQGDYVIPSPTITGFCNDAGAVKPSSAVETLGIVSIPNVGGAGNTATVQVAPLSLILPGSTGQGSINNCSQVGSVAYYSGLNILSCDLAFITDGAGHVQAKSLGLTDTTFAGFLFQQQGPQPTLSALNSVYVFPPTSVTTTYGLQWPATASTGCVNGTLTGSVVALSFAASPCGSGAGSVTSITATAPLVATPSPITTTGVISANTQGTDSKLLTSGTVTGTAAPLCTDVNGGATTAGCPSGTGTTQTGNPLIPVATVNGTPASTDYKYAVVGCEDPACSRHTAISPVVDVATGAATLTNVNSITLKSYGDTLYGIRGYIVCRTAAAGTPSTTGVITGVLIAGKQFVDTGLAGDGTNCASVYASNNTQLNISDSSLPGCNIPNAGLVGPDAPQCGTTLYDDEFQTTFGAPGDVNNPVWFWGGGGTSPCAQNAATASWSNGTIVFTTGTTAQLNCLANVVALPAPPYTFRIWVDAHAYPVSNSSQECFIGLRETSTGKILTASVQTQQTTSNLTALGGNQWTLQRWSSSTAFSGTDFTQAYTPPQAYIQFQNNGTSIITSYSNSGDGIVFPVVNSQLITVPFTTAPNQLIIGGTSFAANAGTCTFDFERRTQ